jgi:phosphate transport system substrate-binding protein
VNRTVLSRRAIVGVAIAALTLAGCGSNGDDSSDNAGSASAGSSDLKSLSGDLKGSGSSFVNAYYQKALDEFSNVAPDLNITYNSTGSGTGKKEFGSNLTDFAGTDSTVKDGDGPAAGSFLYIPTVAAPITVSYHLEGVDKLQLSGDTVGKIFGRVIKTWDDPAIKADNPGVQLPSKPIVVAHRSDGSGTTSNFTKYLVKASPSWKLGAGDTVAWGADTQGGDKNTGVAQIVKQSDGAIGYVDFSDALASQMTFAAIKNKDGKFVQPSLDGVAAALASATVKDDLTYDPLDAAGAESYPITSPTYILARTTYSDAKKGQALKAYLNWLLTDGQQYAKDVNFSKLPTALQQKAIAQIQKIQA